jgi:hypothetical protein
MVVIPHAGHLLILERPREVSEHLMTLLTRLAGAARINGTRKHTVTTRSRHAPVREPQAGE